MYIILSHFTFLAKIRFCWCYYHDKNRCTVYHIFIDRVKNHSQFSTTNKLTKHLIRGQFSHSTTAPTPLTHHKPQVYDITRRSQMNISTKQKQIQELQRDINRDLQWKLKHSRQFLLTTSWLYFVLLFSASQTICH